MWYRALVLSLYFNTASISQSAYECRYGPKDPTSSFAQLLLLQRDWPPCQGLLTLSQYTTINGRAERKANWGFNSSQEYGCQKETGVSS